MLVLNLSESRERVVHLIAPGGEVICTVRLLEIGRSSVKLGFEADPAKVVIMRGSLMAYKVAGGTNSAPGANDAPGQPEGGR